MADVTVMGAGVAGLTAAFECARRGARVRVIDPAGPGGGASGNPVGALAPHVPEGWSEMKQLQLDALRAAPAFWAGVADTGGMPTGFAPCGRLQPLADDRAVARARARAGPAAANWGDAGRWEVRERAEFASMAPDSPTGLVIHDTLSARIDPPRAIGALAAAIRALGGEIARDGPADGAVLWAAGAAGLADLSRDLGLAMGAPVKGQAARLDHDGAGAPLVMAPGLLIVPHGDGTTGVGSTAEREFSDPAGTDAALEDVLVRASALVPALAGAPVIARWAGLRPRAVTGGPILGPWPGRPGHFVANGGFRIGFALAPEMARLMAGLILDGRDAIPEAFTPEAACRCAAAEA